MIYSDLYRLEKNQKLYELILNIINLNKHLNANILFDKLWSICHTDKVFLEYVGSFDVKKKFFFTPFQLNFKQYILLLICTTFYFNKISYTPKVVPENTLIIDELLKTNQSFLVVMLHDGFAHSSTLLQKMFRHISILGDKESIKDALGKSGVKVKINIIDANQYALMRFYERLKHHDILSANVDYRMKNSIESGIYQYISPSLFNFAIKYDLPLLYVVNRVNHDGSVSLFAHQAHKHVTGYASTEAFIDFVNEISPDERILSVRDFK